MPKLETPWNQGFPAKAVAHGAALFYQIGLLRLFVETHVLMVYKYTEYFHILQISGCSFRMRSKCSYFAIVEKCWKLTQIGHFDCIFDICIRFFKVALEHVLQKILFQFLHVLEECKSDKNSQKWSYWVSWFTCYAVKAESRLTLNYTVNIICLSCKWRLLEYVLQKIKNTISVLHVLE